MRIDLFNSAATELAGEVNAKPAQTGNTSSPVSEASGDHTTLTSGSAAISSLVSQAMNTPSIRQDKVSSLQQAISSGQYQLDPDQIAGAMISEHA